jgi:hypothetical protein
MKTLCGLAAAVLILSGCGNGSGSSSPAASATSSPPSATGTSGSNPPPTNPPPTNPPPTNPPPTNPPPTNPPPTNPPPTNPPPPTTGSATLNWTAPTTNSNGSALTDLAGYHIYYGTNASSLSTEIDIGNPSTLTYTVTNLSAGTWYFAITAYTNTGLESPKSNVGSKTIS